VAGRRTNLSLLTVSAVRLQGTSTPADGEERVAVVATMLALVSALHEQEDLDSAVEPSVLAGGGARG
jgi:hypothetical protein